MSNRQPQGQGPKPGDPQPSSGPTPVKPDQQVGPTSGEPNEEEEEEE